MTDALDHKFEAALAALAALAAMDRAALVRRWAEVFGCPAPRHAQVGLLRSALAWRCQMEYRAGKGAGGVERKRPVKALLLE